MTTLACPHCQALNRVPAERLDQHPTCGRCKQPLFQGKPVELRTDTFDAIALRGELPVLVDFWATWCGPCQGFAPVFAEAARRMEPRLRLAKLDTDAESAIASRYGIRSIPTLMLFRDGREIARQPGALSGAQLDQFVKASLSR